ncbi:tetratricopeptide repeat protein [Thermodesulfobacteriota bacterium]
MSSKTPSLDVVSNLSREEWEDLCSSICSLLYSSHRVEDRFGKGNGLDAWRHDTGKVEGWQFRRFNSRLGGSQASHIKENITLAHDRSINEIKKPLTRFTAIFNIDPEPGHKGKKGEIERLSKIEAWAKETYDIEFDFLGVTWVRTQLIKYPTIRPDLFEDLSAAISDTKQTLLDGFFDIQKKLSTIGEYHVLEEKIKKAFETLTREASRHFERGMEYESKEEFIRSIDSLEDALRLIQDNKVDEQLEGKILTFLAGVQTITGFLSEAIKNAEKALSKLSPDESREYFLFAKGNLAFAYYMSQDYTKSEILFYEILHNFERDGNLLEIIRTLGHITELYSIQNNIKEALEWGDRAKNASKKLDKIIGISKISISTLGTTANAISAIGCLNGGGVYTEALHNAIKLYEHIEKITEQNKWILMRLNSKAARARCIWHLDRLDEAATLYTEVSDEARPILPKISTDSKFNLALILSEMNKKKESRKLLLEAQQEYLKMGDMASVTDTKNILKKFT